MKHIEVSGLLTVSIQGSYPYDGNSRPRETSKISATMTDVDSSCDLNTLDSRYLLSNGEEFVYGEGSSMADRAFEMAFANMVHDETATITISLPKRFIEDSLSQDLSLTCKAHLIVLESSNAVYKLSTEEKLALAGKYKNMGVDLYKEGSAVKNMSAYLFFSQAIKWLAMIDVNDSENKATEIKELKTQCYNNLSLYHLQKKHFDLAVSSTTKVLEVQNKNVKALYRRSVANTELQNYEEAEKDILHGLVIDGNNTSFKKQQEELKKRQKAITDKYAVAMKKFFG